MKVLITGGAGFIGYHLACFHVRRGDEVVILDNLFKTNGQTDPEFVSLSESAKVTYLPADLTAAIRVPKAIGQIDVVYHLAAINGTRLFYEIPYEVARANLLVTLNLLDWLETQAVARLVYSSTSETYAGCGEVGLLPIPTDETVPVVFPQPTNVRFSYGTSKFMGEFLCFRFGEKHHIPTSVIRYHNIYGPRMGMKHVIPEFIIRLRDKESPFRIYGGDETRAFCYVDDAVEATFRVGTTQACEGEIVHIGNDKEEISIEALALMMMRELGETFTIQECGKRSGSVARRCPDTAKLKRLTGFEARVALKEGLAKTADWYLQRQP
jgi:nucleoside-diphosphate-sugar epimerase